MVGSAPRKATGVGCRAEELEASSQKVKQQERRLDTARQEHDAEAEQLAKEKARFDEQQKRLDGELEGLEARRVETKSQRQRIAEALRTQHTRQIQEVDRRKAELESLERLDRAQTRNGTSSKNGPRLRLRWPIWNRTGQHLRLSDSSYLQSDPPWSRIVSNGKRPGRRSTLMLLPPTTRRQRRNSKKHANRSISCKANYARLAIEPTLSRSN